MTGIAPDLPPERSDSPMSGSIDYSNTCMALAADASRTGRVKWDVPFGTDPLQRLDVWLPKDPRHAPVCLFFHGGAMRGGHKEWMGAHARSVTDSGAILVSPNYRLTPLVQVVDIVSDAFDALAWVRENIESLGGNPDRIILGGHSSGGQLAGLLASRSFDLQERHVPIEAIQAVFLISGVLSGMSEDFTPGGLQIFATGYANKFDAAECTVFSHLGTTGVPFHVAFGENDAPDLIAQNSKLIERLTRTNSLIGSEVVAGADHFSAHLACFDPDGPWFAKLRTLLV